MYYTFIFNSFQYIFLKNMYYNMYVFSINIRFYSVYYILMRECDSKMTLSANKKAGAIFMHCACRIIFILISDKKWT